jgi:hypothetical protein
MKTKAFNGFLGIFILIVFSFSCASDLDFNQTKDLKVEPVFVGNLAYFDVPANQFVTNGVEHSLFVDKPTVDVFNDSFFKENLKRADLFFEINNTINRGYTIDLIYLDRNDRPLYTMNFSIAPYSGVENLVAKTEVFENAKLDILKNTVKISFVVKMLSGPVLSEDSLGSLKLRSGVTAYFVVE